MYYYRNRKVEMEEFVEGKKYTPAQLDAFATEILRKDRKENKSETRILFDDQLYKLSKREIDVDAGQIDETLTNLMSDTQKPGVHKGDGQKIFNRSHQLGRKTNDQKARLERGAAYYKN